jgi:two-component system sensor histidine kinase DevS
MELSLEFLLLLTSKSPDATVVIDDRGDIVFANDRVQEIFGWVPAELVGQSIEVLIPSEKHDVHRSHRALFLGTPTARAMGAGSVLIGRRRDGGTVPVDVSLSPLTLNGESFVVAAARNAAARQEAERVLRRSEHLFTLEAERERIARDLHDGVIQRLYAAGLHLQATRAADSGVVWAGHGPSIDSVIDEIDRAITDIRATVFALHTKRGLENGLHHAVRLSVAEASRILGFTPRLEFRGDVDDVAFDVASDGLEVARELLVNVAKHARATSTTVMVEHANRMLTIEVADDGVGAEVGIVTAGQGLHNASTRARKHGGTFDVWSSPTGTTARWSVPLHE